MSTSEITSKIDSPALRWLRPVLVATVFTSAGELLIFVVFGLLLYPGGNLLLKLLWTLGFCGIGMGVAIGLIAKHWIEGRFKAGAAVAMTALLAGVVLGIGCNALCFVIDRHADFFGAHENPVMWLSSGFVMALAGGAAIGALLFTAKGRRLLERIGI